MRAVAPKVQVDAAYRRGFSGLGVVAHERTIIPLDQAWTARKCVLADSSTHAEALAIAWAVELLVERGVRLAVIRSDCLSVVHALGRIRTAYHHSGTIRGPRGVRKALAEVVARQLEWPALQVVHVPRKQTQAAHVQARRALDENVNPDHRPRSWGYS